MAEMTKYYIKYIESSLVLDHFLNTKGIGHKSLNYLKSLS